MRLIFFFATISLCGNEPHAENNTIHTLRRRRAEFTEKEVQLIGEENMCGRET